MPTPRVYGILVETPAQSDSCYVIMPYGGYSNRERRQQLDNVYDAILNAATEANLRTERADRLRRLDYVASNFDRTRSAEIIIADCSPEPATNRPNLNVMYELGLAHALGRPTIIVTTDPETLPADLRTKNAVVYPTHDTPGLKELSSELHKAITQLRNRLEGQPVDPDWARHGIRPITVRYKVCLNEAFMGHFTAVVEFADIVRDLFQPLDNELPHLTKLLEDLFRETDDRGDDKFRLFNDSWSRYNTAYRKVDDEIYRRPLSTLSQPAEDAFAFMEENSADAVFADATATAKKFYEIIKDALQTFPDRHKRITDSYPEVSRRIKGYMDPIVADFAALLYQQKIYTAGCVLKSHNLLRNMISVFRSA